MYRSPNLELGVYVEREEGTGVSKLQQKGRNTECTKRHKRGDQSHVGDKATSQQNSEQKEKGS